MQKGRHEDGTILLLVRERAGGCVEVLNLDTNTNGIIAKVLNLNSFNTRFLANWSLKQT